MAFAGKSDFTTWFSSFLGTGAIAKDPTNGVYLILASEGATYGTQVGHLATSVCACSAHDVTQVGGSDYFYSFIVFPSSSSFNCWSRAALILGWTTYNGVSSPAKGSFVKRMALMMEMVHEISEIIVNPFPYTGWTAPSSSGDNYPAHELGDQCSNYYSQLSTSSETCAYSGKNCGTVGANVNTQINGHWYILPALYDWRRNSCANSPSVSSVTAKTQTGLTYYGCYNDGPTRTLAPYQQTGWTGMTTEMCISKCKSLGYALAGVSFGNECYCGNSINGQNGGPADSATCNMACAGNANQQCGGSWRMNIYSTH